MSQFHLGIVSGLLGAAFGNTVVSLIARNMSPERVQGLAHAGRANAIAAALAAALFALLDKVWP